MKNLVFRSRTRALCLESLHSRNKHNITKRFFRFEKLSSLIFIKVDHFSIGFGSLSRYIKQERGRKIARVVIVACHDPPMSNYAYTCVIPKSTNHKFSGYQSYTINTVMYKSPLYPFVPFLMFFYLYKHEPTKFRTI